MATVTDHGTGKMSLNQRLEVTMQEGDPAFTFSCSSDGFPIPTLTWTGPGSGGGFPSGVGVVQNRLNSQQTLVWNRNLVYTDSGSYVCAAQNSKNTSTVTLTLLVESKSERRVPSPYLQDIVTVVSYSTITITLIFYSVLS